MTDPWILMSAYFDNVLNEEQAKQLCEWIKKNPANAEIFARQSFIHRSIYELLMGDDIQHKITVIKSEIVSDGSALDLEVLSKHDLWEELAECEKNGKALEVERNKEPGERVLTEKEREAKIQAFLAEEKALEEQERRLEQEARRKIRERELRRRRRIETAHNIADKVRRYIRNAAIAAVFMVVGFFVYALLYPAKPVFVATLAGGVNVKWADSEQPTELNSPLRHGLMKLEQGCARITFNDGASVILQAPCKIDLQDAHKLFLESGRLSAHVPLEARGFMVNTPSASIVDLGTEFGVQVREDGSSDIHVFEGKVSLLAGKIDEMAGKLFDTVEQIVEAGQARRVKADSYKIQDIRFGKALFARDIPSHYELAVRQSKPAAYWRFDYDKFQRCINGIAPYRYEGKWTGSLRQNVPGPKLGNNGKNTGLRLGVEAPGYFLVENLPSTITKNQGFTMTLWVKLDVLEAKSIISVETHPNQDGFFSRHLFVNEEGRFIFRMFSNPEHTDEIEPVTIEAKERIILHRWYHLFITMLPDAIKMYVDGQLAAQGNGVGSQLEQTGLLWYICTNLDIEPEIDEADSPSINGAIDELAIYNRALSAGEIRLLYLSAKQ